MSRPKKMPEEPAKIGPVEEMVLLAALRLDDEAYSVSIIEEIERRTGKTLAHGAVFVAIRRLARKGLLRTGTGSSRGGRGGRPRLMVKVEPAGREALRARYALIESLREGLSL